MKKEAIISTAILNSTNVELFRETITLTF